MSGGYFVVLVLHSYIRWAVIALAAAVALGALARWRRLRISHFGGERVQVAFIGMLHLQFLLGLLLYFFLSPLSRAFLANPHASLKVSTLRFFGLEHIAIMVPAVIIATIGRGRSKKAENERQRNRVTFATSACALVMMVAATPWPFIHSPRPLFRTSEVVSALSAQPQWTSLQSECPRSYADRCATCHGPGGRGDGPIGRYLRPPPRSFADPDWAQSRTDSQLAGVIRNGGVSHGLSSMMPAQDDLSEPEVRALVRCVRSFSQSPR